MNWIICVDQISCLTPSLYKYSSKTKPSIEDLKKLGADINILRQDIVTITKVPLAIYDAWPGRWLR